MLSEAASPRSLPSCTPVSRSWPAERTRASSRPTCPWRRRPSPLSTAPMDRAAVRWQLRRRESTRDSCGCSLSARRGCGRGRRLLRSRASPQTTMPLVDDLLGRVGPAGNHQGSQSVVFDGLPCAVDRIAHLRREPHNGNTGRRETSHSFDLGALEVSDTSPRSNHRHGLTDHFDTPGGSAGSPPQGQRPDADSKNQYGDGSHHCDGGRTNERLCDDRDHEGDEDVRRPSESSVLIHRRHGGA